MPKAKHTFTTSRTNERFYYISKTDLHHLHCMVNPRVRFTSLIAHRSNERSEPRGEIVKEVKVCLPHW